MNTTRKVIETIVELAKDYAALQVRHIKSQQDILLFGISIGLGRRLTDSECRSYLKTFFTVEAILEHESTFLRPGRNRRLCVITVALRHWLESEPWLRNELEARFGYEFGPPFYPLYVIDGPIMDVFIKQIRTLSAESSPPFTEDEIKAVIHRLEHPLDRA